MSGIYVASKAKHGPIWLGYRQMGFNICSTWINEWQAGATKDYEDLWQRCSREAAEADVLVIYAEKGDNMKGALLEAGIAIGRGAVVLVVGGVEDLGSWIETSLARRFSTLHEAMLVAEPWGKR